MGQNDAGFTFIELIIVIITISILAVVALTVAPDNSTYLDSQTEELTRDLRYVQSLAMTRGVPYKLLFNSSTQYQLLTQDGTAVPHPATGSSIVKLSHEVTLSWSGLPNNYIASDTRGTPYTVNGVPMSSSASITLSASGTPPSVINIQAVTGSITP